MPLKYINVLFAAAVVVGVAASTAAAEMTASIFVNGDAVISTDRLVVTVTGRYTLGPAPSNAQVQGTVSLAQASGTEISGGQVFFTPIADGVEHTFQFNIHTDRRPYHGGKGRVQAEIFAIDCSTCCPCATTSASADVQVSIRGGGK